MTEWVNSFVGNGGWFRIRLRSTGALAAFCLAALAAAADDGTGVVRHLRLGYSLRNTRNASVPLAELLVRLPLACTPWQTCGAPTATRAFERRCGPDGGTLLRFAFTNLLPFANETVWVDVDVRLQTRPDVDTNPVPPVLLAAAEPYDYRGQAFMAVLRTLGGHRAPAPADLGARIVRYAQERIREGGYSSGQRNAGEALDDGRGDCSERMAVVVALCRRAGLPARGIGGLLTARDRVVRPSDYHDWAVYRDGNRWRLADPGAREPVSWEDYVAFEWLDGGPPATDHVGRYRAVGEGVVARME